MSARSKNKNARQDYEDAPSAGEGVGKPQAQDSQPTPTHGFPAVPADPDQARDRRAQRGGNTVNTAKTPNEPNYDFLWEATDTKRSAKGQAGTTTVVESDTDYLLLPHPDVFNAYPPEVQRKIMEWADHHLVHRMRDHHGHVHEERGVCGSVPRSGDRRYHGALFHQEERPLRPERSVRG